jgi:hypothetical protein
LHSEKGENQLAASAMTHRFPLVEMLWAQVKKVEKILVCEKVALT